MLNPKIVPTVFGFLIFGLCVCVQMFIGLGRACLWGIPTIVV